MTTKKGLPIFIYTAAAALAAAVIRLFQYLVLFDFSTGFYVEGGEAGARAYRAFMVALTMALMVLCLVGEKKGWTALTIASDGLGEKTSLYLGTVYLLASGVSLWVTLTADAGTSMTVLSGAQTVVFAVTGLLMMKSSVIPEAAGYIQVLSSLGFIFRSLDCFNADLVIRNHSDRLIVLLAYVFGALFSTASARCYSRLESKHSRLWEITFAGITFIFCGVHFFSKILAYLFGGAAVAGMEPPDGYVICLLLITGGFLCTVCLTTQRKSIEYLIPEDKKKKKDAENGDPETEINEEKNENGEA